MEKDRRYHTVKALLKIGHFSTFVDLFEIIPKSVVARDLGMNNTRIDKLIRRPERFTIWDIERIARFIEVDLTVLMDLILKDMRKRRPPNI